MGSSALDAIPVVDATLSCLRVYIKPLQVVVEIDRASAKVSAQKGCVGREDGGDIYAPPFTKRKTNTSQPFVEMRDHSFLLLM